MEFPLRNKTLLGAFLNFAKILQIFSFGSLSDYFGEPKKSRIRNRFMMRSDLNNHLIFLYYFLRTPLRSAQLFNHPAN